MKFIMPPEGTSCGCRTSNGAMWLAGEVKDKPSIVICEHAGNYVNGPFYKLVAQFETKEDRDFVIDLHRNHVAIEEKR